MAAKSNQQRTLFQCFGVAKPRDSNDDNGQKRKKREADQLYDKEKRKRGFNPEWKTTFKWLELDEKDGKMYCKTCRENKYKRAGDRKVAFVAGSTNFQMSAIDSHRKSGLHKREVAAIEAAEKTDAPADRMIVQMNKEKRSQLAIQMRSVHAIAKHHRPFTDFVWLNQVDRMKGLDVGSSSYGSDKAARTFAFHIAEVI